MLLKFTTADMLNTTLIDVSTGDRAYDIITILQFSLDTNPITQSHSVSDSDSDSDSHPQNEKAPSSSLSPPPELRRTWIRNADGKVLVDISWSGRQPNITIGEEKIGGLTDLFGSSTVRFMPKILAIPTRFDTEYIWTATPESLTLFDYDSDQTKGAFHQNVIRLPKPKTSSTRFINTRVPGLGSNYLEFECHSLAEPVEIIISFLMMEILRRGRFCLTPYKFERPKLWQLREARDLVLRRLRRRNTV